MEIFKDTRQRVRFAFTLEQYPGAGWAKGWAPVYSALHEAGVERTELPTTATAQDLRNTAIQTLLMMRCNLMRIESMVLTAAFSRNCDARRDAVEALVPHFRKPLTRLISDWDLIGKLVRRHYIAARERGPSWDIGSISTEFKVAQSRVHRASQAIDQYARQLETLALASLQDMLTPKKTTTEKETAHA